MRVLFVIENLSVPDDRRVWPECLTLAKAGHEVVVVCPKGAEGRGADPFVRLEGVDIHRYPPLYAKRLPGYLLEYSSAFWHICRLARRLAREKPFDVVHAGNPPDFLLLATRSLRRDGTRFIFDHHDLVPELYVAKFNHGKRLAYWLTRQVERLAFRLADVVIATNESYRALAIERGGKRPEDVFVVRNGPDLARIAPVEPDPGLKRGKPHLLAYVGKMAPQDGVDHAIRALGLLRALRDDWHALFVGDGDVLPDLRRLVKELRLEDCVEFTGAFETDGVVRVLSTADVCLAPEPRTPLNSASTLIKIAEYMAIARPVVSYDLVESRFTAGDAALYATPNDPRSFVRCIETLLDDADLRTSMGKIGRDRVERKFSWEHSARNLLEAYDHVRDGSRRSSREAVERRPDRSANPRR
jgi:glycosyltransferase involved in cell wall biosynthesis